MSAVEWPDEMVQRVAAVINREGGEPDHSIHSWRCQYPDAYGMGPCTCVADLARMILDALHIELSVGRAMLMSLEDQPER